jgi:hypothetical protein
MHELFPIVGGVLIALVASRLTSPLSKTAVLVVLGVALGGLASFISGELAESWAYLAFDIVQVLIVAGVTLVVVAAWERRSGRVR